MIRAIVGAGGKTTRIHKLAAEFRAQGKRVFVTTSTHMFIEPDTVLSDDADTILGELNRVGYVMAGIPRNDKICPLSPETYRRVCAQADEVLVEADGSKHKPIKFPNSAEPVIYDNVEQVEVVCGLQALGKPLREVAHRPELVMACLGVTEETVIAPEHIVKLVREGYLRPMREKHRNVSVYPAGGTRQQRAQFLRLLENEEET